MKVTGDLHKMHVEHEQPIQYRLNLSDEVLLNDYIGHEIKISFNGVIHCVNCGRSIRKAFGQGFCYPCFDTSAMNSPCIIKPELCRGHLGEGRDPEWEQKHHVQPHFVYLAVSSGLKVGVTRTTQVPTRWIDQGASYASIIAETSNRYEAGVIEVALKDSFADKTNWQRMLKNEVKDADISAIRGDLDQKIPPELHSYLKPQAEILRFEYPVIEYPSKVKSQKLEKVKTLEGKLMGIKGQYLLFDDGRVINIRNHSGYEVSLEA